MRLAAALGTQSHTPTPHPRPVTSLVAAFGSGACFSLISGLGKPGGGPGTGSANPLMAAFSTGVVFALFQGAFFKVRRHAWASELGRCWECAGAWRAAGGAREAFFGIWDFWLPHRPGKALPMSGA